MKKTTALFWTLVAGIGVAFVMTIVTAVSQHRAEKAEEKSPSAIPTPAELPR